MSDKPVSESRRDALKAMMGGLAAVPLMSLVGVTAAQAKDMEKEKPEKDKQKDDLPTVKVDMESNTAMALKYTEEAPEEKKKAGQICSTCQFLQADSGDWRPCQLFPGKVVAAKGWCVSWMKKSG